jgi:hypothetical protein
MCLHALSSFQRTGCHPDSAPLAVVGGPLRPYSINSSSTRPLQGEPFKVTTVVLVCQSQFVEQAMWVPTDPV